MSRLRTILSPKSIERRSTRTFHHNMQNFFAVCPLGLEEAAEKEIKLLPDVEKVKKESGGVSFSGPSRIAYDALLRLRCPVRILLRLNEFHIKSYPELFDRISRIPWESYIYPGASIEVRSSSQSSKIHHTTRINDSTRAGIVKRFSSFEISSNVTNRSNAIVLIRIIQDICTVSLDLAGDPMYKRGFRSYTGSAPIRENIISSLLLQLPENILLNGQACVVDPFCGSGTILLEAAGILSRDSPGLHRDFSLKHSPLFKQSLWNQCERDAVSISSGYEKGNREKIKIRGYDIDPDSIMAARKNVESFINASGCEHLDIDFLIKDSLLPDSQSGETLSNCSAGLVISNLPYGKKVPFPRGSAEKFYKALHDVLSRNYRSWSVLLIGSDKKLLETLPLNIRKIIAFKNGGIPVYAIYGSVPDTDR